MSVLPEIISEEGASPINFVQESTTGKRTYMFDFNQNEFITDVTNRVLSTRDDAEVLKETVQKILCDERYKYLIYPDSYGNEISELLSQDMPYDILISELKRVYREALVYHPLIEDVQGFSSFMDGEKLFVEFTVIGVSGVEIQERREVPI